MMFWKTGCNLFSWDGKTKKQMTQPIAKTYNVERSVSYRESPDSGKRSVLWH